MKTTRQQALTLIMTIFVLIISLFNTVTAFADDSLPPTEPVVATQEPVGTDIPSATEEPIATGMPVATVESIAIEESVIQEEASVKYPFYIPKINRQNQAF